jgi:ATP-dependent Clp protease ATP-binding subunit ClpC
MASTRDTGVRTEPGGEASGGWWKDLGTISPSLFGAAAIDAFRAAEEEARRWQHNYIGTEHLLLAILHDPKGLPAMTLGELGAPPDTVRAALEYRLGRGDTSSPAHLGVAPRARIALELAREDMRFLKHGQITPEHVLLGLVQVPQGVAALILESMGLSLAQVRTSMLGAIPLDEASPRFYWHKAAAAASGATASVDQ